jgi:subtilisin family serine protease
VLVELASDADAIELGRSRRGAAGTLLHARRAELQNVFARFGVGRADALGLKPSGATERRFRLEAPAADTDALVETLRRTPGVVWAEPNRVYRLTAVVPNDPYWRSSGAWGQGYQDLWAPELIGAPTAWARTDGAGVVVAVVDSGVDYGHPDIAANIWRNAGELGTDALGRDKRSNGVDDDENGFVDDWRGYNFAFAGTALAANDPMDDVGHGTHVAGTIAAVAGNGLGIAGVAPGASVMAVKAFRQDGTALESDLIAAISYAARNGAHVINASWGLLSPVPDLAMIDAVDEAWRRRFETGTMRACTGTTAASNGPSWSRWWPVDERQSARRPRGWA